MAEVLVQPPPENHHLAIQQVSLFHLPGLLSVGLIEQLYLLTISCALLRLPPAVLAVSLHGVRYSDIDGLRLWVAAGGD